MKKAYTTNIKYVEAKIITDKTIIQKKINNKQS